MTTAASITRRRALAVLGALAVASVARPLTALAATQAADSELETWLVGALGGADLAAFAMAWRAKHPTESSRETLARAVLTGRRAGEPLAAYLARQVAAEHAAERSELLDGWYLTPTEARLVVLAS